MGAAQLLWNYNKVSFIEVLFHIFYYCWAKQKQNKTKTNTFVIARTYKTYLFFDLNLLEFFLNFFESSGLELQIKTNSFNALLVKANDSQIFGFAFLINSKLHKIPNSLMRTRPY